VAITADDESIPISLDINPPSIRAGWTNDG
jgi:hypothetical protein